MAVPKRRLPGNAVFVGYWRITHMDTWSREAMDQDGPAFISLDDEGSGDLRFAFIRGWPDCRFGERDGKPLVEFSWDGVDGGGETSGRGWAVLDGADKMTGALFIHRRDDSPFKAERQADPEAGTRQASARR